MHEAIVLKKAGEWSARETATEREGEFAALVHRNARRMFRVAYSLLHNSHDAEDAVQEAFLKLYRGQAWRRIDNEQAFLGQTVWRLALDRLPRQPQAEDAEAIELTSALATPEQCAAGGEQRELLRQMLNALPEELRQPLVLSAIEEMTSREVAEIMGIPEATVRTRIMRAKTELKKRFEAMQEVRR